MLLLRISPFHILLLERSPEQPIASKQPTAFPGLLSIAGSHSASPSRNAVRRFQIVLARVRGSRAARRASALLHLETRNISPESGLDRLLVCSQSP